MTNQIDYLITTENGTILVETMPEEAKEALKERTLNRFTAYATRINHE